MKAVLILITFIGISITSAAQNISSSFGQNRVQTHRYDWFYYESDHFKTYYYIGGQEIAKYVVMDAEKCLKELELQMEFEALQDMEILVYNSYSDLQETNLGLTTQSFTPGGTTHIVGNKVFVYFDGNHLHLQKQIREGIANMLLTQMLWGGNIQEILMNGVLLNLPDWFFNGLVDYLAQGWSPTLDDQLKEQIQSGKLKDFKTFAKQNPRFAGHAMWYYIASNYGTSAIPNLIYITRINRNLNAGFNMSLGVSYNSVQSQWYTYYKQLYLLDDIHKNTPDLQDPLLVSHRKKVMYNFMISDDGKNISYVENKRGKYKVKMADIDIKNKKKIYSGGQYHINPEIHDRQPLIAWSHSGDNLACIAQKNAKWFLNIYNINTRKKQKIPLVKFNQVHSFSYGGDDNTLLVSAIVNGHSDIYLFKIKTTNITPITDDVWDDIEPTYFENENQKGILFSSNRFTDSLQKTKIDSILPIKEYDIWYYDLNQNKDIAIQITQTDAYSEFAPKQVDDTHFQFLSEQSGIVQLAQSDTQWDSTYVRTDRIYTFRDSTIANPKYDMDSVLKVKKVKPLKIEVLDRYRKIGVIEYVENSNQSIVEYDVNKTTKKILATYRQAEKLKTVWQDLHTQSIPLPKTTTYATVRQNRYEAAQLKSNLAKKASPYFQNEFQQAEDTTTAAAPQAMQAATDSYLTPYRFRSNRSIPYVLTLQTKEVSTQLDNSILFNNYEPISPTGIGISNPDLSGFFRINVFDLLEDKRFYGGFRFPTTFKGTEYFFIYENLKNRIDFRTLFYRKSDLTEYSYEDNGYDIFVAYKIKQTLLQQTVSYPFTQYSSLRGTLGARWDQLIIPARDYNTTLASNGNNYWSFLKLEAIYDNAINPATNIWKGFRGKIYGEFYKKWNVKNNQIIVLGIDVRDYRPIYKNVIFANRFAAASSIGASKVLYYMGGVENWMVLGNRNIFDATTRVPTAREGYAYQSFANNMRGFIQNTRNGNNYAVTNTELRIPIFQTLFHKPLQSGFLRNLQAVGFVDIGSAWKSQHLFSNDAATDYVQYSNPNVTVLVDYFRSPIIAGYGAGLRSTLFGYFIKFDIAWGWDNGFKKEPVMYFSIGTDF